MGQKWKADWWPTSALFKDYTLNIYGGKNGEGMKVGLYKKSGSPNEEWRRKDFPERYIGAPEIQLGVLRLEGWGNPETTQTGVKDPEHATKDQPFTGYVPLPGDTDSKDSYAFPFIGEVADGCTFDALCDPTRFEDSEQIKKLLPGVEAAIKKLVEGGAQAIIGNCGLFMWLHATGLIEHAVDNVMDELGSGWIRPYVMLSSLATLGSCLATLGVGEGQEEASARWNYTAGEVKARECKVVVFTSNGDSCKALLNAIPQLQNVKVFTPDEKVQGDVLVVGLDGKKVIGLGRKVGGESVNGFDAVRTGQPMLYDIVQPDIMLVAKAVKETYPTVCMAYVECTEVTAYSDTIRQAMRVPVNDPNNIANGMIEAANNHNFSQLGNSRRIEQISSTLRMPVAELVKNGVVDALLPEVGASDDPLHDERQRARAKQIKMQQFVRSLPYSHQLGLQFGGIGRIIGGLAGLAVDP